jgi:hypothetical protein
MDAGGSRERPEKSLLKSNLAAKAEEAPGLGKGYLSRGAGGSTGEGASTEPQRGKVSEEADLAVRLERWKTFKRRKSAVLVNRGRQQRLPGCCADPRMKGRPHGVV